VLKRRFCGRPSDDNARTVEWWTPCPPGTESEEFRVRLPRHATVVAYVALFVALGGSTYAATGGTFVLGHANSADHTTSLKNTGGGPALSLVTQKNSTPPLFVSNSTRVANLNADKLDGKDSTAFETRVSRIFGNFVATSNNSAGKVGPWSFSVDCEPSYGQLVITGPGTVGGTYSNSNGVSAAATYVKAPAAIGGSYLLTASDGHQISATYFLTSGATTYQVNLLLTANNPGLFEDCDIVGDGIRVR
jgi:hypothetical protein